MKTEHQFIQERQGSWKRLEILLSKNSKKRSFKETIEFGNLYKQVGEDYSQANTDYPDSQTAAYLNTLLQRCFVLLSKPKPKSIHYFLQFFSHEFPAMLYKIRGSILFAALIFILSMAISFFMVLENTEFAEIFLDQNSYEMAQSDLELRQQFGNFDNIPPESRVGVSLFIWINNSTVSLLAFALGFTLGLGTLYVLIRNGFMVGALLGFYFQNGHFIDFISLIMIHGTIELTAIAIAGGAGLYAGTSILMHSRRPRRAALKSNTIEAFKVFWGVVILLFISGLIEGLITPAKPPVEIRTLVAGLSVLFLIAIFLRARQMGKAKRLNTH
jgi:uncharacterized membrane protein SpoIIM required for sporulation